MKIMKTQEFEMTLTQLDKQKADEYSWIINKLEIKAPKKDLTEKDKIKKINDAFECDSKSFSIKEYIKDLTGVRKCVEGAKINSQIKLPSKKMDDFLYSIKEMDDGQNIQMAFWLLYSLFYVQKDFDEAFKNVCRAIALLNIKIDEIKDLIHAVKYSHNHILDNPKYESYFGIKYFDKLSSVFITQSVNIFDNNASEENQNNNEDKPEDEQPTQHKKYVADFKKYIDARFPMVFVDTIDEKEAVSVIKEAASCSCSDFSVYEWTLMDGLVNIQSGVITMENASFDEVLMRIENQIFIGDESSNIYIFRNIEDYYERPQVAGKLKILSERIQNSKNIRISIFLIGRDMRIGNILEKNVYYDDQIGYPDDDSINKAIKDFLKEKDKDKNTKFSSQLVSKCKGLTHDELNRVLSFAYIENNNDFNSEQIEDVVQNEKRQTIKKTGLIELVKPEETIENLGGFDKLKEWLEKKAVIINNAEDARKEKVDVPKGTLLIGMPGCGKSLTAKITASMFNVPLLKIDVGSLMDKYVGESEHNFKKALKIAEAISPCVLWVDEIEKAFSASNDENQGSSELSNRILGNLLTWMQEKKTLTFVVATANNVKKLPPEFLRKGRFDEIFFLDLPTNKERKEILKVHLAKRGITFEDIDKIAYDTDRFSGAELEYIVRDVTEQRFINILKNENKDVSIDMFKKAIEDTEPLSTTMKTELDEMRKFCNQRKFRKANE